VSDYERGVEQASSVYKEVIREYVVENSKLRELVRDMHTLATDPGVYVRYPYCDAWDEKLDVVEKQMCELGIEVTE